MLYVVCLLLLCFQYISLQTGHYDSDGIAQRLDVVLEKRAKLKERSEKRRHMLEQSLQLQRFNRDVVEAEAWCAEKSQIATDESYRDPTNLQVSEALAGSNLLKSGFNPCQT